jgi:hypothetical protein
MVGGRVVKRPRGSHRFLKNSTLWSLAKIWLKWRPGGATRGKWGQLVGKVGEWVCGKPAPPRLYPPPVSIKDRSVSPREQVLNVPITCRWYGPDKPSSRLSIGAWLFPTALWLLWERSWVRTRGSVGRRAMDCVGSPSSWVQWICSNLLMTVWKIAICGPREIRMVVDHTRTERGKRVACWLGFSLQVVHRFESPRLSDMSNCLFVAVFS